MLTEDQRQRLNNLGFQLRSVCDFGISDRLSVYAACGGFGFVLLESYIGEPSRIFRPVVSEPEATVDEQIAAVFSAFFESLCVRP